MIPDRDDFRLLRKLNLPSLDLDGFAGGGGELVSTKRIGLVADSLGAGRGSGLGSVQMAGARELCYLSRAALYLRAWGYNASTDSLFGNAANTGGSIESYDSRVTLDLYSETNSGGVLGGFGYSRTGTSSSGMLFTPKGKFDSFRVFSPQSSTLGGIVPIWIDNVSNILGDITQSTTGADALQVSSFTTTLGLHSVGIGRRTASTGATYLHGIECWDSTASAEYRFLNFSARGWQTSNFVAADKVWRPLPALDTLAVDILVISLCDNDILQGTSSATAKANLITIAQRALAAAPGARVLLYRPPPFAPSKEVGFSQATMLQIYLEIVDQLGCDFLDSWAATGSYSELLANGEIQTDLLHLMAPPYDRMGAQLAAKIVAMTTSSDPRLSTPPGRTITLPN